MNPGLTYFFKCQRKKNKYFYFSHDMNILTRGQKILAPYNRKCNLTICLLCCMPKQIIYFPSCSFLKTNFDFLTTTRIKIVVMITKFWMKYFLLNIQCILNVDFELMSSICEIFTDERTQWNTRTLCAKDNIERKKFRQV